MRVRSDPVRHHVIMQLGLQFVRPAHPDVLDGDRIRPGELRASIGMAETPGRGCGENREEAARGETAGPIAEHAGGKAVVSHDQPGGLGRILQLGADKARTVASKTLADVYDRVGFLPRA